MKRIVIITSLLMTSITLMAQPGQGKFKPEEFKAKLESFVTTEAGFTPAEAQVFYPVYFEMKDKQRQLQHNIHQLKKDAPKADAGDKEFAAAIQKIKDMGVEISQLEATYYKRMCKVVSPQKVYRAMCAEDKFHRRMLEGFGHDSPRAKRERPRQNHEAVSK